MKQIIVATKNQGKLVEYKALLEPFGFSVLSLYDFPELKEPREKGKTFLQNALIKARSIARKIHMPVIADDSGLEVRALKGKPGVKSRRFSPENTDAANNELLLKKLTGKTDRFARFVCQIVYYDPETGYEAFMGTLEGEIALKLVEGNGFGYDPLFFVPKLNKHLSELSLSEKNAISHRSVAFMKLIEKIGQN
ncbi:MAG: RdgB/HAM1 family non-canonical purine NTP pyrophosphatase [Candidatus Izemoplasmatales bacterium]